MRGWVGLGALASTELESRMLSGPRESAYLDLLFSSLPSLSKNKESIFHPSTNALVPSRTASAMDDFKRDGTSDDRVMVSGRGSGISKLGGSSTLGLFVVGLFACGKRSFKNPSCKPVGDRVSVESVVVGVDVDVLVGVRKHCVESSWHDSRIRAL